jgi:hypothetical protein
MYKARRTDVYFRGELNKFIQAAENHARNEKPQRIPCPCKTYKNMRVLTDIVTIRSHVLVGGFVEDYMIWTYHGEKAVPTPMENTINEMIENVEFDRLFDAYDEFCADVGNDDGDGVGKGPIDGDSDEGSDDKLDADDFLSQLLRQTTAALLVGTAKGLANFKAVKKLVEENLYE